MSEQKKFFKKSTENRDYISINFKVCNFLSYKEDSEKLSVDLKHYKSARHREDIFSKLDLMNHDSYFGGRVNFVYSLTELENSNSDVVTIYIVPPKCFLENTERLFFRCFDPSNSKVSTFLRNFQYELLDVYNDLQLVQSVYTNPDMIIVDRLSTLFHCKAFQKIDNCKSPCSAQTEAEFNQNAEVYIGAGGLIDLAHVRYGSFLTFVAATDYCRLLIEFLVKYGRNQLNRNIQMNLLHTKEVMEKIDAKFDNLGIYLGNKKCKFDSRYMHKIYGLVFLDRIYLQFKKRFDVTEYNIIVLK